MTFFRAALLQSFTSKRNGIPVFTTRILKSTLKEIHNNNKQKKQKKKKIAQQTKNTLSLQIAHIDDGRCGLMFCLRSLRQVRIVNTK